LLEGDAGLHDGFRSVTTPPGNFAHTHKLPRSQGLLMHAVHYNGGVAPLVAPVARGTALQARRWHEPSTTPPPPHRHGRRRQQAREGGGSGGRTDLVRLSCAWSLVTRPTNASSVAAQPASTGESRAVLGLARVSETTGHRASWLIKRSSALEARQPRAGNAI